MNKSRNNCKSLVCFNHATFTLFFNTYLASCFLRHMTTTTTKTAMTVTAPMLATLMYSTIGGMPAAAFSSSSTAVDVEVIEKLKGYYR